MQSMELFVIVLLSMAFKSMEAAPVIEAMDNTTDIPNNRFQKEIGLPYNADALEQATDFVFKTFEQKPEQRKNYSQVLSIVESFTANGIARNYPDAVASTINNIIRINQDYIQHYNGDVKYEFTGILYHESTHVWQWDANGNAPSGVLNGIADYVRLKAGWPSKNWQNRGSGLRWDQGYEVTAYFLEYCTCLRPTFVSELNARMKYYYSEIIFNQLLGKSADDLWYAYKAKYETTPTPSASPSPPYY